MIRQDLVAPLSELLDRQAATHPDKTAFEGRHGAVTFAELNRRTRNLATRLRGAGLETGDAVAVWLPNSVDWVVTCLATVRAGGISVPISFDSKADEATYRLDDAACRMLVTTPDRLELLTPAGRGDLTVIHAGGGDAGGAGGDALPFREMWNEPAPGVELVTDDIDATGYIVYTSGTTGKPKGVKLTTRGMLWVNAACWAPVVGIGADDVILSPLPLFHSYALNIAVLGVVANGATEYIMDRFSPRAALDLLNTGRFTTMPGVPTMFHYLMQEAAGAPGNPFASVKRCISAGAIMPATLNNEFEDCFGVQLLDGYGITETSTMVTMNWPGPNRVPGSCGLPVPGLAVRLVDPASGADVTDGAEGELICRGPNLMQGYHNKPAETAKVLKGGWYHTGDLARADKNGFLTITGRLKEIIIRGGQNIAPAEVEETILKSDAVLDCAIVGVAHETLGEVPYAFVVPKDGSPVDVDALLDHCRATLSKYKVPVEFRTIDQIPRTGSGKIMRFRLRDLVDGPSAD